MWCSFIVLLENDTASSLLFQAVFDINMGVSLQVIEKYLSGGMCGYDREGSPIWYDVIGPVDPKGLFLSASKQDFIKSKIRDCEMLQKECNLQSERVRAEAVILSFTS